MLRINRCFILAALAVTLSACGVEPTRDPAPGDDPASVQPADQAAPGDPGDPASSVTADDSSILANCSIVQFCNVPNSSEGTRCVQQPGCTVVAAENECKSETTTVCGSPVATWVFVTTNGVHHTQAQSCVLSNRCGTFNSGAACQCDSFCTTAGDCCFDGPC